MAPPPANARPSLSITLPPNFAFTYNDGYDGSLPKTPTQEQENQAPLNPPPPPRPQTFKVRRKRAMIPEAFQQEPEPMSDAIIPTIEMSEAEVSSPLSAPTPTMEGLLAPALPTFQRLVTPPKTPAPRAQYSFNSPVDINSNEWDLISQSKLRPAFERSGSVGSSFSDSSISSCGSSAFSAPNNCASPESEATDPFLEHEDDLLKDKIVLSPDMDSSPTAKRAKTHRNIKWTTPMDDHLWMTFLQYLGDPRVTPFKMLAGTAPPLGVCHRVASKARRTWSSRRTSGLDTFMEDHTQREGSPDTIRPSTHTTQPRWPRSEGATRKRLRNLCKRRPSLPAHYQRLLNTRSPSPFTSSSSSAERTPHAAFANYEMKMSLITSTNPSMQPEGPLAQLSSDEPTPARPQTARAKTEQSSRPSGWFARIPRSQAHQKSLSLQSGLSINVESIVGTLASPFDDSNSRTHLLESMSQTKSLGRAAFDKNGPSLDSPVELSGAPTASRTSLKRRFRSDEEKPKRPALRDVFTSQTDDCIVRNRGFTVGAVRATDNLAKLFTPLAPIPGPAAAPTPSSDDHVMDDADAFGLPDNSDLGPPGSRSAPRRLAEPVPRLGSPFAEFPSRQVNTFPRSYLATPSNPQPFQQRLRELAAHNAASQAL